VSSVRITRKLKKKDKRISDKQYPGFF